jgi:hypothetical protein
MIKKYHKNEFISHIPGKLLKTPEKLTVFNAI